MFCLSTLPSHSLQCRFSFFHRYRNKFNELSGSELWLLLNGKKYFVLVSLRIISKIKQSNLIQYMCFSDFDIFYNIPLVYIGLFISFFVVVFARLLSKRDFE